MYFFTDIDNTILYSHRYVGSDPVVWVEQLNSRDQSFIPSEVYRYFKHQDWLTVVPVTTRNLRQYDRLRECFSDLAWNDVLICNGAIRMVDGREDMEWTRESLRRSEPAQPAFRRARDLAVRAFGAEAVVSEDPFLFYIRTADAAAAFTVLSEQIDARYLSVNRDARKVYCMPTVLNKGTAVRRYMDRFGICSCIAAGDSDFDIPMLCRADICLCPESIYDFAIPGRKVVCRGRFADGLCIELEKLRNENYDHY